MYQLIEHPEKGRMGVHSVGDLDYMLRRGWKVVGSQTAEVKPVVIPTKKRGRPPKAKQ